MEEQILETWDIHARVVLFLLDGIEQEASLRDALGTRARTVADHLAHIHNVRLMWLKAAAPELMETQEKIEAKSDITAATLRSHLEVSGTAIHALLAQGLATGRIKSFKPHPVAFLGYLIHHEGYHLGKVDMILRQCGHPVSDKTHYGLWEWGVR